MRKISAKGKNYSFNPETLSAVFSTYFAAYKCLIRLKTKFLMACFHVLNKKLLHKHAAKGE